MRKLFILVLIGTLSMAVHGQSDTTKVESDTVKAEKKKKKDLPLEPGRTIKISTDEGTWMSLDVSPDGQTIVFDMLGDLYTLPISGGKATRLTSGMEFDMHPRFSPDGKSIVFVSDKDGGNNIWVYDLETEKSKALTKGKNQHYQSADWTPDGEYIVTAKGRAILKLHLLHKDGGAGAQLIKQPAMQKTHEPAVSPDGRYIWYSFRNRPWDYNASLPQYQLATYDRKRGESQVETSRYGSAFTPTLSPDGKFLVYGTRYNEHTGLVLRELATGDEKWLAYPVQRDEQESIATMGVYPAMSFTPDSKFLIASYGGKFHKIPVSGGNAINIPFSVEEDLEIGPQLKFEYPIEDTPEFTVTQIRDAVLSPDGSQLAFTALNRLYIQNLPDGTPKRVTDFDFTVANPAWSPDGASLAFVTWEDGDGGHVYKVNTKGKAKPVQLTETEALYSEPAWSADGGRIVYLKGFRRALQNATGPFAMGAKNEIWWVPSSGGSNVFIEKKPWAICTSFQKE